MPLYVLAGAIGAAIAYFFDPENGRRRRKIFVDKAGKYTRRAGQRAQGATAQAEGLKQKATHLKEEPKPQPDDVTLARKVETEIFRDADAPKGSVVVTVANGIVELRGETDMHWSERLETEAAKVSGVQGVRNLTHRPGETPPNLAGTPGVSAPQS